MNQLALSNLKKYQKLYLPFLMASVTMISMTYLMLSLVHNTGWEKVFGGHTIQLTLSFGVNVVIIVSVFIILYANSFVMKNRAKEIGLYGILGLERKHLYILSVFEMFYFSMMTIFLGMILAVLFDRFIFAILLKILGDGVQLVYQFHSVNIIYTVVIFLVIFILIGFINALKIKITKPLLLLKEEKRGEVRGKFLKTRAAIGLGILLYAYYLSQTLVSPLQAVSMFFYAVVLVLVATFLLFDAGSIVFLNYLKKRKSFYYLPQNFISISNLVFRMRKNAAGLASICILSTMVLVTLSTTSALHLGAEKLLTDQFTTDYAFKKEKAFESFDEQNTQQVDQEIQDWQAQIGVGMKDFSSLLYSYALGKWMDEKFVIQEDFSQLPSIEMVMIDQKDYQRITGDKFVLNENELLLYSSKATQKMEEMTFENETFKIVKQADIKAFTQKFPLFTNSVIEEQLLVVVPNLSHFIQALSQASPNWHENYSYYAGWNSKTALSSDEMEKEATLYRAVVPQEFSNYLIIRDQLKRDFFAIYGSLFFLGIVLSIAFFVGTVLVIYYKQLSEGYEDRDRFDILQKIGLDETMVKQTINRQILIVFYLPLVVAFLHTTMAFKMFQGIIKIFGIQGPVVIYTTLGIASIFTILYAFVFRITSRSYLAIVKRV